jgi:hypothetical protein
VADEHAKIAVMNALEHSTSLLFIEGGKLVAIRSIRIGTAGAGLHGGTATGESDAAAAGAGAAAAPDPAVETARTHDYLVRLTREIRRTVSTLPDALPVDAIYATGPGAVPGSGGGRCAGHRAADLLDRVTHDLSDESLPGPRAGVALRLAFKLNGQTPAPTSDARRAHVRPTRSRR